MVPPDGNWDEALERLEDFIAAHSQARALPDLDAIAERAGVPRDFLVEDERASKVLLEAIGARPLSSVEQVGQLRTEVELLTLEVEVLTDRLRTRSGRELRRAASRIRQIRARLDEIRRIL